MYVKVFSQVLESSIADDYQKRHLFIDLLILADREGVVDMTREAISRRLNVPIDVVNQNLEKLLAPDPHSRGCEPDGRRLIPVDPERDWGWQIVNYVFYRDLKDLESLRAANRERKRRERERKRSVVPNGHVVSQDVRDSHAVSQKVTVSEAVSYSETNKEVAPICGNGNGNGTEPTALKKKKVVFASKPETKEICVHHVVTNLGLEENDGLALWDHWVGNGFKNNGKPMDSWRHTASTWRRRGLFFPSLQPQKR